MKKIYNISIYLYVILIRISALFKPKSKLWLQGRKDIFTRIDKAVKNSKNIVWFHCASLGEFEQGKPIIKAYNLKHPQHKILLTLFSPSGFEISKKTKLANWVFFLPADTAGNAKRFVSIVKPKKAIFIKYEFWFNYMETLNKNNIPFYSVSTIFRNEHPFLKHKWFIKQLQHVTHFFVQDEASERLLKMNGFNNITISGDTRFDSVLANTQKPAKIPLIEIFSKNKRTIICGSTWPKDEHLLISYIKNHPENNYVLAPHELEHISKLQKQTDALLYSKITKKNILTNNVIIIDNIGILSTLYQYGDLAYIGGGFSSGIHNILEAVAFGLPVIFGPNYQKYNEAISLIKEGGAISISNYQELKSAINILSNFNKKIALNYIEQNIGGTDKILPIIS